MLELSTHNIKKQAASSSILLIGILFFNLGNFLFYLIAGKFLNSTDYGNLVLIFSLLSIISTVAGSFTILAVDKFALFDFQKDRQKIFGIVRKFNGLFVIISIFICIIFALFSNFFTSFFHLDNPNFIYISLPYLLIIISLAFNRGVLQGERNFKALSLSYFLEGILKIGLVILAVVFSLSVFSYILGYILSAWIAYILILANFNYLRGISHISFKEFFDKNSIILIVSFLFLSFYTNLDIFIFKHYFDPNTAGIYSIISILAKVVLFLSGAIVGVMFPMIVKAYHDKIKHYPILINSLILVTFSSMGVMIIYSLFGGWIMNFFAKNSALLNNSYLLELSIGFFIFALANVFITYFMAIKDRLYLIFFFGGLIFEIIILIVYRQDLTHFIRAMIISGSVMMLLLSLRYLILKGRKIIKILS
jgi:O-antigen/teichoic acid export membrane protein